MTPKMTVQELRDAYQAIEAELETERNLRFKKDLNKLIERYGVYTASSNRINLKKTLIKIGFSETEQTKVNNWLEGKNSAVYSNHSRSDTLDLFLKTHLYELELKDGSPIRFTSVFAAFNKALALYDLEPLYILRDPDFYALLAMKLQDYKNRAPQEIFAGIYHTYTELTRNNLLQTLAKISSNNTEYVDVTDTVHRHFARIISLGDPQDTAWSESGAITAYQFIHHYRAEIGRYRITPFLVLSECFSHDQSVNWDCLKKDTLRRLAEDNSNGLAHASNADPNMDDPALPPETQNFLLAIWRAIRHDKTPDRSTMLILCTLYVDKEKIRQIIGAPKGSQLNPTPADRRKILHYLNDEILKPCKMTPISTQKPKCKEDFAVTATVMNAPMNTEYPLGHYICSTFLGFSFEQVAYAIDEYSS